MIEPDIYAEAERYAKAHNICVSNSAASSVGVETSRDARVMQFVVFAIESAAEKAGRPSPEIHNRLARLGLIEAFLVESYDTLHTQGKEYIADAVLETLHNWEDYYAKKGDSK